jgi:hypothetical protein
MPVVDGTSRLSVLISPDSRLRLRGNDEGLLEKLPDPSNKYKSRGNNVLTPLSHKPGTHKFIYKERFVKYE